MTIPLKYEDLVLKVAELERREAALREELDRHKSLYDQLEKALSRVHCMYVKRLLDLTGERQTVLVPDEEFVKYFEELKCLKGENSALQQRLTVAEQELAERNEFIKELIDEAGYDWLSSKAVEKMKSFIAALKPAEADPIQKFIDENPLAKNEAAQALLNRPKRWSESGGEGDGS